MPRTWKSKMSEVHSFSQNNALISTIKNLIISNFFYHAGIDTGLMGSGSSRPYSNGITGLQCLSFALLAVWATKAFVSV
jgi:hypothetical protein